MRLSHLRLAVLLEPNLSIGLQFASGGFNFRITKRGGTMHLKKGNLLAIVAAIIASGCINVSAQTLTTLHSFNGADGSSPEGTLVQGSDGNLYGTTPLGGAHAQGTVFRITSSGAITVLHSFNSFLSEGAVPVAGLIQASDGNFYGTTAVGGQ